MGGEGGGMGGAGMGGGGAGMGGGGAGMGGGGAGMGGGGAGMGGGGAGMGGGGAGMGGGGAGGGPLVPTPACDAPTPAPSMGSCIQVGAPGIDCNPVTNFPCAPGDACDYNGAGFSCFLPPNTEPLCAPCGEADGYCQPGMICLDEGCARYCCNDGDCGSGYCDKTLLEPGLPVGICLDAGGGTGGAGGGGAGGAGGGGMGGGGMGGGGMGGGGMGGAGGGGSAACMGVFTGIVGQACDDCLVASCCQQVATCDTSGNCVECSTDDSVTCNAAGQPASDAVLMCAHTSCQVECFDPLPPTPACDAPLMSPSMGACVQVGSPGFACNPVTNAGCAAGAACDVSQNGFICYAPPNTETLCDPCGAIDGYCQGGMTCVGDGSADTCAKYCCNNGDCGTGTCDLTYFGAGAPLGICVQ
jgi:hypothetical protein